MGNLSERYQQGYYQEVYDELLAMGELVFTEPIYNDALLIAKVMMQRVRYNIELIIHRLSKMDYRFGEGFWEDDILPEEKATIEKDVPILGMPDTETPRYIALLKQSVGILPLLLEYWYREVGSVNLIGLFPAKKDRTFDRTYGSILDPLFLYSVEMAFKMISVDIKEGVWKSHPFLSLSPDGDYKYCFSGSRPYSIALPCKAFDASLLFERHQTTFINYLRTCFRWGGFPGLELENRLSHDEFEFLTKDLLQF